MDIGDLCEDDFDAVLDVRNRSFGMLPAGRRERWLELRRRHVAAGSSLVVRDAGRAVAAAHFTAFRQWWHGRPVDMAGVGGVVVAPEYRGRGVGGLLMRALLDRMRERGFQVSALFPATVPPYRRVGYELAGQRHVVRVPTAALRTVAGSAAGLPAVRRAGPADAERMRHTLDEAYRSARECGPFTWPVVDYATGLGDDDQFDYLAADGALSYRWSGESDLHVNWAVAGSADTSRALWAQVGSHASIAETVTACVPPTDPLFWLLPDTAPTPAASSDRWMLRLLDVPSAIAARGFPPSATVDVPLEVTDPDLPANTGHWRLVVANGTGTLQRLGATTGTAAGTPAGEAAGETAAGNRAGNRVGTPTRTAAGTAAVAPTGTAAASAPLRLDGRGLAALYAGTPVSTLRRAALAGAGDPSQDPFLDAAFRSTPTCRDHF